MTCPAIVTLNLQRVRRRTTIKTANGEILAVVEPNGVVTASLDSEVSGEILVIL